MVRTFMLKFPSLSTVRFILSNPAVLYIGASFSSIMPDAAEPPAFFSRLSLLNVTAGAEYCQDPERELMSSLSVLSTPSRAPAMASIVELSLPPAAFFKASLRSNAMAEDVAIIIADRKIESRFMNVCSFEF